MRAHAHPRSSLDSCRCSPGFSLVYSRSQVGLCLTRGWPTMIRVTCLSHSEPGGDFGDLSAACIPRYRCRFSSRTVWVCECGVGVSVLVFEGLRSKKKDFAIEKSIVQYRIFHNHSCAYGFTTISVYFHEARLHLHCTSASLWK